MFQYHRLDLAIDSELHLWLVLVSVETISSPMPVSSICNLILFDGLVSIKIILFCRSRSKSPKRHKTQISNNRFSISFIEMWIIMLSGPCNQLPVGTMERIFLATCLFSSIIFSGSFQVTMFISRLQKENVSISNVNISGIIVHILQHSYLLQRH